MIKDQNAIFMNKVIEAGIKLYIFYSKNVTKAS